jgi:hypothetical protein
MNKLILHDPEKQLNILLAMQQAIFQKEMLG